MGRRRKHSLMADMNNGNCSRSLNTGIRPWVLIKASISACILSWSLGWLQRITKIHVMAAAVVPVPAATSSTIRMHMDQHLMISMKVVFSCSNLQHRLRTASSSISLPSRIASTTLKRHSLSLSNPWRASFCNTIGRKSVPTRTSFLYVCFHQSTRAIVIGKNARRSYKCSLLSMLIVIKSNIFARNGSSGSSIR